MFLVIPRPFLSCFQQPESAIFYGLWYPSCHNIVLSFLTVLTLLVLYWSCAVQQELDMKQASIGSLLFPVIQLLPSRHVVSHCLITSSINYDVLPQLFPIAQPPVPQINQLLFDLQHLSPQHSHLTPAEAKLRAARIEGWAAGDKIHFPGSVRSGCTAS